jgi:putative transposase
LSDTRFRRSAGIFVEGLRIADMIARAKPRPDRDIPGAFLPNGAAAKTGLNTSISDASWAQFLSLLAAKAQDAGRRMIDVDPRYSADRC